MLDFLAANWLWIVLIGAFVLMHSRGGGCGMHGGHGHGDHSSHGEPRDQQNPRPEPATPGSHDHTLAREGNDARTAHRGHAR